MGTNFDSILDKLAKIQELIDRGATAGEVAAATGRMQALLSKHNLSIEMVAHRKGIDRTLPTQFVCTENSASWARTLAMGLADANYGKAILCGTQLRIVCHKDDWATIKFLFAKFEQLVQQMAPIQYQAHLIAVRNNEERNTRLSKREWCNDWRAGCAKGIGDALRTARREAERETDGSSALVVIKDAAVAQVFQDLYPRTVTGQMRGRASAARNSGYATGQSLGRGTSINR